MDDQWEYAVEPLGYANFAKRVQALDYLGKQGWELVCVTEREREVTAYLKRRVR